MHNCSDAELLHQYAVHRSEPAFGEIINRYADTVYSAALRHVGNEAQARDIAQTVFVDLARKAGSLSGKTLLIGWLYRGTRLAALEFLRKEQRRLQREKSAMELYDSSSEDPDQWQLIRPMLDEEMSKLDDTDRNALLLRFFKNQSLTSVGTHLGVSEDAAQKRVSRALTKLRDLLAERGVNTPATALSGVLAMRVIEAVPPGLCAWLAADSLAKASVATASASPVVKLFTLSNMKIAIPILALTGGLIIFSTLYAEANRKLLETQAAAQLSADDLTAARALNDRLVLQTNELEHWRNEARDVLRLRNEVARLTSLLPKAGSNPQVDSSIPESSEPMPSGQSGQISIKVHFVTLPSDFPGTFIGDGMTDILTDPQWREMAKAFDPITGATNWQSQVVTLCGNQAQLQQMPNGSNEIPMLGATIDVIPWCTTNSSTIELDFVTEVTLRAAGDRSAPLKSLMTTTNHAILWDGQTVVTERHIVEPDTSFRLLVFVTPTLIDAAGNRLFDASSLERLQTLQPITPSAQATAGP